MEPLVSELLNESPDLADLIEDFVKQFPELINELEHAHAKEDWVELNKLVHNLKGLGGGYGYPQISDIALTIEGDVQNNNFDSLKTQFDELRQLQKRIELGIEATS